MSDPSRDLDPHLKARLAAKEKLHPTYASPYDRPVKPPSQRSGRRRFGCLYLVYWLLLPAILLALLWYIRSALAPFLAPSP